MKHNYTVPVVISIEDTRVYCGYRTMLSKINFTASDRNEFWKNLKDGMAELVLSNIKYLDVKSDIARCGVCRGAYAPTSYYNL